jgi:rod shape-determining protein MreB and related proteins
MEVLVSIFADRMEVSSGRKSATVRPSVPYAGRRILVGTFQPAVDCLQQGLREVGASGVLKKKPALRIQAMEMNEGGLSEVEERCLQELGLTVGARSVEIG